MQQDLALIHDNNITIKQKISHLLFNMIYFLGHVNREWEPVVLKQSIDMISGLNEPMKII